MGLKSKVMFINRRKKILYSVLLVAVIAAGIKSYAYIKTENGLTGVNIVKPAQEESSINGIAKISAKTFGKASNVDFIIKNNTDGSMKTVKAFFENATNEWCYYLNSMEIVNGNYTIKTFAHNGNLQFQDAAKIKIENDGNGAPAPSILTKKNNEAVITEKKSEEKKEQEKIEMGKTEQAIAEIATSSNESAANAQATTTEANTQILNAVVKALSNIYDTINNNLAASETGEPETQAILEGKVAGTSDKKIIRKEDLPVKIIKNYTGEQSITSRPDPSMQQTPDDKKADEQKENITEKTEENNWFKYDLKLSGIENGKKISNEKMLSASCNNPLDSVIFIIDNLETPEIDYKFDALNNYGYYTYWTYKINPKDIKKGEYLLYARGTIDWYNYESPMIIISVE